MFLRPKPAAPPEELPRMGKGMGAVNPLAHLDAEWLGVDPGETNMATVAHEERSAAGTRRFADTVLATYDPKWAEVSKPRWANAKFRLYCGKKRVVAGFWSKLIKQAKQRWPDRVLALAYGAAGFNGSCTVGCRGFPVSQMLKGAVSVSTTLFGVIPNSLLTTGLDSHIARRATFDITIAGHCLQVLD
ncbi:uncharacterized protein HaLaN_15512 [Haematococcus lacustris]|uniref:Uncharacterized protein n=1 Tax=Haematococcus lacustris TaxID=44745 RepID=A0A699ZB97_HAELA|nr:uncharacterized protein HaLaN_15512 [Haematococcus lacustris]